MTAHPSSPAPEARREVVLVCLALDETSDWALLEGARLASDRDDAELHVVHAVAEAPGDESLRSLDERLGAAPAQIQRRIEALWARAEPLKVIAHIGMGDPVRLILQTADDVEADVIVVGSHRRGGIKRMLLGSVAEEVLRSAHCPVLIAVPRDYSHADKPKHVEPPCAACLEARTRTEGASYWCERHAKSYVTPHIYRPHDSINPPGRSSVPGML